MCRSINQSEQAPYYSLKTNESYAGLIIGKGGSIDYHLILLPGQLDDVICEKAKLWAQTIGGELPALREQSLLLANLPECFGKLPYWSSEAESSMFAFYQNFSNGHQGTTHPKTSGISARAVRRVTIK